MNKLSDHRQPNPAPAADRNWISAAARRPPWRGWPPVIILPTLVFAFTPASWPRWAFMWLLAFAIYAGCKWLTWRRRTVAYSPPWRHAAYLLAWPGLDADAFLAPAPLPAARRPTAFEWLFALAKTGLGFALLFVVAPSLPPSRPLAVGWTGMLGIVFVLHFGLFHLLSCLWRSLGVDAKPLMQWPGAATGVSEFWGRRWNTAFRDLTHRFLFRPLTARVGGRWALLLGFVFSGLVHDLVITIPAGGGYGGPTLFFLIQGLAAFAERGKFGKSLGLGRGWRGWLFTTAVLVLPVGLLFPPVFVEAVIVPLLHDLWAAARL